MNSMAARATRLVARQSAGSRRRERWQLEEVRMDDIQLPRHVIDRLEHRWANRLQQDAKGCLCPLSTDRRTHRGRVTQCAKVNLADDYNLIVGVLSRISGVDRGAPPQPAGGPIFAYPRVGLLAAGGIALK